MNYLTSEQITELKNKRAEWVNDSDLSKLKTVLKDNGYKIDINMNTNHNNVFDIIYKNIKVIFYNVRNQRNIKRIILMRVMVILKVKKQPQYLDI